MKKRKPSIQLTKQQRAVLEYLREQVAEHGCPPSAREICDHFGFASPNSATGFLKALERKGCLTRQAGQARNIRLAVAPAGVPIVGDVAAGQPILAVENITGYQLKAENESFAPIEIKGPHYATGDEATPDFRIAGPVVGVVRMMKP